MYKKMKKIIASLIVLMMMVAHINTLGMGIGEVLASELSTQNSKTKNANVEFDSYFIVDESKTYEAEKNIGEENKIVAKISVKNDGYLKNAKISFGNSNFDIVKEIESDKVVNVNQEDNSISLNQIDNGDEVIIEVPFVLNHNDNINISKLSKINTAEFTGIYVDAKGKENKIKKDIMLELKWTANAEAVLESNITKYVPYDVNGQKGLIIELNVNSKVKDNLLPIKENNIEISIPKINEILPEKVSVRASENNNIFEYNYDNENGIVTINAKNETNESGDIIWSQENNGEYTLTLNYSEEAKNTIGQEGVNVRFGAFSKVVTYSYDEKVLEKSFDTEALLNEQIGEIVTVEVNTIESLSKGQMYANYDRTDKLETEYQEKVIAHISMPELIDKILINKEADSIESTYYKNVELSRSKLKTILGEDGIVKINENVITLKDEVEIDENGNEIVKEVPDEIIIELNSNSVTIETSKPIAEGKIEFNFIKAINAELSYSKSSLKEINSIQSNTNAIVLNGDTQIINKDINSEITLVEPTTNTEFVLNTTNLSTIITNENVEIKAILHTDSLYNKLYNNPIITIDLPAYVEEINIKDIQLLFDEELKIANSQVITTEEGRKQIVISIEGIQTKYSIDSVTGGANLILLTDIAINNLTPNKQEEIKFICVNEEEIIEKISEVNFIAPLGIVTVNKISNYVDGGEAVALTENKEEEIEIQAPSKNVTAEIQVINNYSNVINNVRVLGRTLTKGTTNTDNNSDLENTFDAPMLREINTNGMEDVIIYYSTNGSATEDLNDINNGWVTQVEDFSTVKSYLIVLNNYTMNIGDSVKFTYDMLLPENLNYSQKVSSLYTVYFDNIQEEQIINDKANSCMITLGTSVAPELEIELRAEKNGKEIVREGQYVKFVATIKNIGSVDSKNTVLNVTAPSGRIYTYVENGNILFTEDTSKITNPSSQIVAEYSTKHVEYVFEDYFSGYKESDNPQKSIQVGTIKAGEQKEVEYEILINKTVNYENNYLVDTNGSYARPNIQLKTTANVGADDMNQAIKSNECTLNVKKGILQIDLRTSKFGNTALYKNEEIDYIATIYSMLDDEVISNSVLEIDIPNGLSIQNITVENARETDYEYVYNQRIQGQKVIIDINEIPKNGIIRVTVSTKIGNVIGEIKSKAVIKLSDNETFYSREYINDVQKAELSIRQEALDNCYVKEKEEITYTYKVKNLSGVIIKEATFSNIIPEGMKISNSKIIRENFTRSGTIVERDSFYVEKISNIGPNEEMTIEVIMEAELLPNGMTEKEVYNYAELSGEIFEKVTSNSVKTIIEYNSNLHKTEGEEEQKEGRYIISGYAWLDQNANGKRDEDESLLTGIEVRLLDKNTNEVVKDVDSGNDKITTTSSSGEYRFTNLKEGEYLVVFNYNSAKYNLTAYKKSDVSQSLNSDVVDIEMEIDGVTKTVAISDTIKVTNSNVRNIDIGLIESERSDLRLDKYISRITLTYGNTVKTYDYNNDKIAKVEIPAKELSNATVIVEYKIVVTNEGGIPNYVRKIVDYVPKDMKFNSELNRDWYQSSNGDIYNSSLANTKLESGESKEVTLQLTRKMTNSNTGIVNNNAELYEVYNEEAILDADSTPANKISGEDDMSAADVVISVKTGDAVIYTLIISTIICITMGISIYYIRKIVLRSI